MLIALVSSVVPELTAGSVLQTPSCGGTGGKG